MNGLFTKILFNMSGESGSENRSGWNYFPVFVTVTGVGHDTQGVYLAIEETGNYTLPQEACWDFYQVPKGLGRERSTRPGRRGPTRPFQTSPASWMMPPHSTCSHWEAPSLIPPT